MVVPPDFVDVDLLSKRKVQRLLKEPDCRIQFLLLHNFEYMVLEPKSPDSIFKRRFRNDPLGPIRKKRTRNPKEPLPTTERTVVHMDARPKPRTISKPVSLPLSTRFNDMVLKPTNEIPTMSGTDDQLYESFNGIRPKKQSATNEQKGETEGQAMKELAEHLKYIDSPDRSDSEMEMRQY